MDDLSKLAQQTPRLLKAAALLAVLAVVLVVWDYQIKRETALQILQARQLLGEFDARITTAQGHDQDRGSGPGGRSPRNRRTPSMGDLGNPPPAAEVLDQAQGNGHVPAHSRQDGVE